MSLTRRLFAIESIHVDYYLLLFFITITSNEYDLIVIAIDDIIYHIVLPVVFYAFFFGKSQDLGFLPVAPRSSHVTTSKLYTNLVLVNTAAVRTIRPTRSTLFIIF